MYNICLSSEIDRPILNLKYFILASQLFLWKIIPEKIFYIIVSVFKCSFILLYKDLKDLIMHSIDDNDDNDICHEELIIRLI